MSTLHLPNACNQFGAAMGRRNEIEGDPQQPCRLQLTRLEWVDYDYDQGGAYWGRTQGDYIYCAHEAGDELRAIKVYVRAQSRQQARAEVRKHLPRAHFVR